MTNQAQADIIHIVTRETLKSELAGLVESIGKKPIEHGTLAEEESGVTEQRPDFGPTQVRDKSEIKLGMVVVNRHRDEELNS